MDNLALRVFSSIDFTAKSQAQRDSHEERLSIPAHTSGCNTPATKNEGMAELLSSTLRILGSEAEGFCESIPEFDRNLQAVWVLPGHG